MSDRARRALWGLTVCVVALAVWALALEIVVLIWGGL
jgi:hypothetical protein